MTTLLHTTTAGSASRPSPIPTLLHAGFRLVRAILGWPLRVHANRKLLGQMAGMSARDLADIGLTPVDLRDSAALPLDSAIGHFLSARAASHRGARRAHERTRPPRC